MSVSNTTSNTTPLPVSADATDAAPLQINDEARESATREDCNAFDEERDGKRLYPVGHFVQLAINSATEKWQQENVELERDYNNLRDYITAKLATKGEHGVFETIDAVEKERDQLHTELLATQAQVEQLREKIQECCSCLDAAKSGSDQCKAGQYVHGVLTESLSLPPATALAPIVDAHLKSLKALEEYDRLVANGDFYFNCKAHLSGPAQAANKHALQLLGVKEEK